MQQSREGARGEKRLSKDGLSAVFGLLTASGLPYRTCTEIKTTMFAQLFQVDTFAIRINLAVHFQQVLG